MERIAKFEKVSYDQFLSDTVKCGLTDVDIEDIEDAYSQIKLPTRATTGSAGYDFYLPFKLTLQGREIVRIPTGIRCQMDEGWFLALVPKSGLGFKYGMRLTNTMGIIDSDYYYSDNQGHIMAKFDMRLLKKNESKTLEEGQAYMQGIFLQYGITTDDDAKGIRNGGFGSTSK